MVIDKREQITLPKWLVILVVPLLVGAIGGAITGSYNSGARDKQVEINTGIINTHSEEIKTIKDEMFTKEDGSEIKSTLRDINNKLDQHLLQPTKPVIAK